MPAHRKKPPPNAASEIETLASTGFGMRGIAAHFGVSAATVQKWLDEHPVLKKRFAAGKEKERHALHNALYRACVEDGKFVAGIFLLKSRHGYRENDEQDTANKVSINFQLQGAMTPEQYELARVVQAKPKVIDAVADNPTE